MTKQEYKSTIAANNTGRGPLDLFQDAPLRSAGADMIAERLLPNLGRGTNVPRLLAVKLECMERRFAGAPIALP